MSEPGYPTGKFVVVYRLTVTVDGLLTDSMPKETLETFLVCNEFGGQDFQRDGAREFRILREINFAHPALTNFGADFVTTESSAV